MKLNRSVNFWTKAPVEVPALNMNNFHRVNFQSDDLIIGFFKHGNRAAETLTADDMRFLTSYYCQHSEFEGAELAFDIVGRDMVRNPLPNMRDTFLRIRKGK
jgi:hypothetical protein